MSATLKIMSLNVRGISNFKKRRTIFTWCRRKSADVIFFYKKRTQTKQQKYNGKMNGAEKCFFHTVAQIHVELQY